MEASYHHTLVALAPLITLVALVALATLKQ